MADIDYWPSDRWFEAAACGAPIEVLEAFHYGEMDITSAVA